MLRVFAPATCPQESLNNFQKCENEATDFSRRVILMQEQKSHECGDLSVWLTKSDYATLMKNFSGIDKEKNGDKIYCTDDGTIDGIPTTYAQHYPHSYYLGDTARNFLKSFNQLPIPTRYMLNKSLNYQVRPIINAIRWVAHTHMMDYMAKQDEMFGPR